jgi:hypothetical protein
MSIKQLRDLTGGLAYTIDDIGDIENASIVDLEQIRNYAGDILLIFEKDNELYHTLTHAYDGSIKNDLKTLAVVCHKALPLKDRLDQILGIVDWWDLNDMSQSLADLIIDVEEESNV